MADEAFKARQKAENQRSSGNIDGACDGCSPGLIEMYQDYIEGRRELRDINMAFNARYTAGATGPTRSGCDYANA